MLKPDINSLLIASSATEATVIGTKVKQITGCDDLMITDSAILLQEKATGSGLQLVLCCLQPGDNRWAAIRKLISEEPQRIACIALLEKSDKNSVVHALANGAIDALPMRNLDQLPLAIIKAKFHLMERTGWHSAYRQFSHSEARFRAIIDNSYNCFLIYNEADIITYVSPGVKRYFGYDTSDMIGQSVKRFIHPDYYHMWKNELVALHKGDREVVELVQRGFTKSGEMVWIKSIISDQRHVAGVEGFVSNLIDITPLILAQQEREQLVHQLGERVKEQNLLYRTIHLLHISGYQTDRNEVLQKLAEIIPSGWQYPESTTAIITLSNGQAFTSGDHSRETARQEASFDNGTGEVGTLSVIYTEEFSDVDSDPFLKEEADLIKNLATILSEFFEKQAIQRHILEEQSNLQALINNTNDFVWSVDVNLRLIKTNNAFREQIRFITGRLPVEGESVLNLEFGRDSLEKWKGFYLRSLAGEKLKVEESYVASNGELVTVESSLNPIVTSDGDITGISCITRDVSENMNRMRQIEDQNKRLQEVAWMQSHMVRAPAANILGLLNFLNVENLPDQHTRDVMTHLKTAVEQLDSAIRNVVQTAEGRELQQSRIQVRQR